MGSGRMWEREKKRAQKMRHVNGIFRFYFCQMVENPTVKRILGFVHTHTHTPSEMVEQFYYYFICTRDRKRDFVPTDARMCLCVCVHENIPSFSRHTRAFVISIIKYFYYKHLDVRTINRITIKS